MKTSTTFNPAHSAVLDPSFLRALYHALDPDTHPNPSVAASLRMTLEERSNASATPEERKRIAAYQSSADTRDGEVEVDDDASVSMGDDEGAYVQAWVWVPDEKAGLAGDGENEDDESEDDES